MIRHLFPVGAAVLLTSCSSLPVPGRATAGAPTEEARQIIKRSAARQGDAWINYREVKVGYTGEWSTISERLQPILTDSNFRKSSVETYQPAAGRVEQVHTGPQGIKTVNRQRPRIQVSFNGSASTDREVLDSAALVADAYTAFLFGPSWLSRMGADFKRIGERTLDGERCHLIAGRLSPGFGNSGEDHFIAWISRDSSLMRTLSIHPQRPGFDAWCGCRCHLFGFPENRRWRSLAGKFRGIHPAAIACQGPPVAHDIAQARWGFCQIHECPVKWTLRDTRKANGFNRKKAQRTQKEGVPATQSGEIPNLQGEGDCNGTL